jgi:hypothetical protein
MNARKVPAKQSYRSRGGRDFEEDIIIEERRDREVARRPRSFSVPRRPSYRDELEEEAEYYNRKQLERAYVGEAHNGATKDWTIVDVPPGTERVKMDGAGGSSQEVTWQRYNGVRRAKFLAGDREFDTPFGIPDRHSPISEAPSLPPAPARHRPSDMWTEITKDLVIREAIERSGLRFEETDFFFYVMEYLRYVSLTALQTKTSVPLTQLPGGCFGACRAVRQHSTRTATSSPRT